MAFVNNSNDLFKGIQTGNPQAGMCVHGTSAGGAAAAYTLAWYGGQSFIDKVTMVSGPPLSDIKEGCRVPVASAVSVCSSTQFGCNPNNSPSSWSQTPYYTDATTSVQGWTGHSTVGDPATCKNPGGTSSAAEVAWKAMSIVDGSINSFVYKNAQITAWLCANVYSSDGLDDGMMNNSSPQGQLFFQNFTGLLQIFGLTINAVTNCNGDEGAASTIAIPPSNYAPMNGLQAVESEMTSGDGACTSHHTN